MNKDQGIRRVLFRPAVAYFGGLVVSAVLGGAISGVIASPAALSAYSLLLFASVLAYLAFVIRATERAEAERASRIAQYLAPIEELQTKGVFGLVSRWEEDLVGFRSPSGQRLRERIKQDRGSTWYVVTALPQGLQPWLRDMVTAVGERDITVRWITHTEQTVAQSGTLQLQHRLLGAPKDVLGHVRTRVQSFLDELEQRASPGLRERWEVYASSAAHTFMAFLSVPGPPRRLNRASVGTQSSLLPPGGSYGFVYVYPMYIRTLGSAPGIHLEAPDEGSGEILAYYLYSVLATFSWGEEDGFLTRIWP